MAKAAAHGSSYRLVFCRVGSLRQGDTCPKRGGGEKVLGDGQCDGCRHFKGVGHFVSIKCAHPNAPRLTGRLQSNTKGGLV